MENMENIETIENIDGAEIMDTVSDSVRNIPTGAIIGGVVVAAVAGAALIGRKIYHARKDNASAESERKGFHPIDKLRKKKQYAEIEDLDSQIIDVDDAEVSDSE